MACRPHSQGSGRLPTNVPLPTFTVKSFCGQPMERARSYSRRPSRPGDDVRPARSCAPLPERTEVVGRRAPRVEPVRVTPPCGELGPPLVRLISDSANIPSIKIVLVRGIL